MNFELFDELDAESALYSNEEYVFMFDKTYGDMVKMCDNMDGKLDTLGSKLDLLNVVANELKDAYMDMLVEAGYGQN